jgi:phage protein D
MTESASIASGQDFYVPAFQVQLQDKTLAQNVVRDVIQVTYRDNIKEIDSFEITINNWDAEQRTFKYSDGNLFIPGKEAALWLGYYGRNKLQLMLNGEITSLRPTFPAAGQPTLAITGLNVLHRFRTKQESHTYQKMTDSEIARQIGSRLGIAVRTDPNAAAQEERYPYLAQKNEYDIIFLIQRARLEGYDLLVEEVPPNGAGQKSRLYFGPSVNIQKVNYRLRYGATLIEFQPNLDTANQVSEVRVQAWDQEQKQKIEYTARRSQLRTRGVGSKGGQQQIEQAFGKRQEVLAHGRVLSKREAQRLATERLELIAKNLLTGSGSVVGLPSLRAGSVIQLEGLGDRFSGRYFVTATTHTIGDGGYTTSFECRREELKD